MSKPMTHLNKQGRTPEGQLRFSMSAYNRSLLYDRTDADQALEAAAQSWEKSCPGVPLPSEQALEDHRAFMQPGEVDSPDKMMEDRIKRHLSFIRTRGVEVAKKIWVT